MTQQPLTETLRTTLAVFTDVAAPLTATEVADRLGLERRATYGRLERLADQGRLESKKVGASARVWWRPTPDRGGVAPEWPAAAESLVEDVLDDVEVGIFVLDATFEVAWVNEATERYFGLDRETVIGRDKRQLIDDHVSSVVADSETFVSTVLAAYDENTYTEHFECRVTSGDDREGRWLEHRSEPIESGAYAGGRVELYYDVTDSRDREQELRRERDLNDQLFDTAPVRLAVFDTDGSVERMNAHGHRELGLDPTESAFLDSITLLDAEGQPLPTAAHPVKNVLETGTPVSNIEVQHETPAGNRRWASLSASPLFDEAGDLDRVIVAGEDITERKEKERRLTRQRDELQQELDDVFERIDDAFYALDDEMRFVYVNDSAADLLDHTEAELLGRTIWEALSVPADSRLGERFRTALETQTPRRFERYSDPLDIWELLRVYPSESGLSVYFTDITDRKEREQALRDRLSQQEAVADLSQRALGAADIEGLLADGVALLAETLGTDYAKVLDLDETGETLRLRQGVGWDDGVVGSTTVPAVDNDSQSAYTLQSDDPVRVIDLQDETRFNGPDLLTNHDVRSGVSAIIGSPEDPWGILGVHDTDPRSFSEHDVNFVQSVANLLATAIDRREHRRTLVHQREQLAALNNVNQVVQDITEAVIEQSSREEIEETVCQRLAAADSYLFAWTGDVDGRSQTVDLRTEAGVDGYLDGITISVDPDDPRSEGPTGRAVRTGEIQTTQDIRADERYDPWRDHIEEYGVRSSAAIPIVHEETTYGVLNVYADRPNAFAGPERTVIAQLGEVVGHAIAATQRERALLGDEVVELAFHVHDLLGELGVDSDTAAPITFDHVVPLGDGAYLVFGTTAREAIPVLEAIAEAVPSWQDVSIETDGTSARFELRETDTPLLRALSAHGGSLVDAVITDGDFDLTLQIPPGGDVRQVIDAVQADYPGAELVRRRQFTPERDDPRHLQGQLVADLTDRQRTALETAYHAGMFEWPREASGEDVAETIGVASPTFHQHLRKAERKVFDAVFSSVPGQTG
jgi:PAS domain S-box-containing protein